ncbi:MAG TPA: TonB-dependent receptor plug domain-containing protein, partial [Steroidobacteraceae bacterium]
MLSTRNSLRIAIRATLLAALAPVAVQAQDAPPAEDSDNSGLETIVVTGVASAGGVKKLEASYNIVTATDEEIRRANPKSTADLLKISPGMWPESTGGQTGANIEIAGFPGGGDAPYDTPQLMGSPLYGMPTLSFFETTTIFRLDETVRTAEIVQGGPSVVFASGQMGATANFLLKTGSDIPEGTVGLTYGDENLMRVDAFYGFPVGENWLGSIGGFWRTSDGVRDPEFPSDEGGQLTATLKHEGDSGQVTFYARYLDDKNQFITPVPLIQRGTDEFSAFPGFDPLTSTYYSNAIRRVTLPGYPNGGTEADLANGRGAQMVFLGADYDHDFGNGWSIVNKLLYNAGDVDTNALFSGTNPATLDDELYDIESGLGGFELPAGSATATFVGGGAVAADQSVIHQGWWFIHKELENLNNDFRLSKELFDGNTLTAGIYLAYYTMDDEWALGNQMFMTNEPNARPIT